jgi:Domain of unknown function (DUF5034)
MIKKVFIILFLSLIITIITNCCTETYLHELTEISLLNLDNSLESGFVSYVDSILASAYGILINFTYNVEFETNRIVKMNFGGDLYATSCNIKDVIRYKIAEISITSDNDFNNTCPAGASLNDLFLIENDYESDDLSLEIDEFIEIYNRKKDPISSINIILMDTPQYASFHNFTISIKLENGTMISATTLIYLEI